MFNWPLFNWPCQSAQFVWLVDIYAAWLVLTDGNLEWDLL